AIVAYLPGALIFRIPDRLRARRAQLPADERAFWGALISVAISSLVVLLLAWIGVYTFRRLLAIDLTIAALIVGVFRRRLTYARTAARPHWTIVYPLLLVAIGAALYFPTAEYI